MTKNTALLIAGIVFAIVCLAHLLRLIFAADVMIANYLLPMWTSWLGFFVSLILSILMFSALKRDI